VAQQAQDTFVAEVDGAPVTVVRGQVFPDKHPVVKVDAGRGVLFRPLDIDAPEPKAQSKPVNVAKGGS
jgi:hypothetical protein